MIKKLLIPLLLLSASSAQYSNKPILGTQIYEHDPSLVALWLMNEGAGNTVYDLSGNGHGTIVGGSWVAGYFGSALNLSGSGQYIDCGTSTGGVIGGASSQMSIVVWFKADVTSGNDGIFSMTSFESSSGEATLAIVSNTLRMYFNLTQLTAPAFTDTSSWHQVVSTFNDPHGSLYLDGKLIGSGDVVGTLNFIGLKTIIGAYYSSSYPFDGQIDNVSVYNRVLSASEIADLYREPFAMFERPTPEMWVSAGEAPAATGQVIFMSTLPLWLVAILAVGMGYTNVKRKAA